jgi:site-specific DNA-methyltransferase (adenine-specific)
MKPRIEIDGAKVFLGDCRDVLKTLPDNSVDSIVTDPPYELGFMGKSWDSSGIAYDVNVWRECLRVLKPGGHVLAFGGSRTWHRLAVAVEDAGFELRDSIAWLSNKTFPKSLDVSKAIDKSDAKVERRGRDLRFTAWMRGCGITAKTINELTSSNMGAHYLTDKEQPAVPTEDMFALLRPHLPAVPDDIERLVFDRTVESKNFAEREVIGQKNVPTGHSFASEKYGKHTGNREVNETKAKTPEAQKWEGWGTALKPCFEPVVMGRKPLDGTVAENVIHWGVGGINIDASRVSNERRFPANVCIDETVAEELENNSRYFFVGKATKTDRGEGLDGENFHPTVKPTQLMRYLIKLITPSGGTILDPFTGSGSTGKAALLDGYNFIGAELTEEYLPIIEGRLTWASQQQDEETLF